MIIPSTSYSGRKFTEGEAFIGYQKDTPAAVVFQATRQLEQEGLVVSPQQKKETKLVNDLESRVVEETEDLQVWKENVSLWFDLTLCCQVHGSAKGSGNSLACVSDVGLLCVIKQPLAYVKICANSPVLPFATDSLMIEFAAQLKKGSINVILAKPVAITQSNSLPII